MFDPFFMPFILGFVFVSAFQYASGGDMQGVLRFGAGVLAYFVLPGGMLFFQAALSNILRQLFYRAEARYAGNAVLTSSTMEGLLAGNAYVQDRLVTIIRHLSPIKKAATLW